MVAQTRTLVLLLQYMRLRARVALVVDPICSSRYTLVQTHPRRHVSEIRPVEALMLLGAGRRSCTHTLRRSARDHLSPDTYGDHGAQRASVGQMVTATAGPLLRSRVCH
jgi:hypothetical protein